MKLNGQRSYADTWLIRDDVWDLKFTNTAGDSDSNVGLCDPGNKTIYIIRGLNKAEIFKTFVHEILHAIEDEYEIDVEHKVIEKLELGIANFILDNRVAFLRLFEK